MLLKLHYDLLVTPGLTTHSGRKESRPRARNHFAKTADTIFASPGTNFWIDIRGGNADGGRKAREACEAILRAMVNA